MELLSSPFETSIPHFPPNGLISIGIFAVIVGITFYNAGGTILKLLFEDAFLGSDYWLEASKPSFMTVFPQVVIFILLSMAVVTFLFLSLTNSLALAIPLKTSSLIALTPSRFCNWAYRNKSKYLVVSFFLYRSYGA